MQCRSPILVDNGHKERQFVPCGRCHFCLVNKRSQWTFRIEQEIKRSSSVWFLTLTYHPDYITYSPGCRMTNLYKPHLQLFIKRLRKFQGDNKVRYYAIGEYGEKGDRAHYHMIVFNITNEALTRLEKIWKLGFVKADKITPGRIHYITSYIHQLNTEDYEACGLQKPFALMSKKPPIGSNYLESNTKYHRSNMINHIKCQDGKSYPLPRFYKDRMFSKIDARNLGKKGYEAKIDKAKQAIAENGFEAIEQEFRHQDHLITRIDKSLKNKKL